MSDGIKISNVSQDVLVAANKNLVLTSDLPTLKIVKKGTATYTFSSDPAVETIIVSIAHGRSFKPAAFVQMDLAAGAVTNLPTSILGDLAMIINYRTTATNLEIYFTPDPLPHTSPSGNTYTFKYYIFDQNGA